MSKMYIPMIHKGSNLHYWSLWNDTHPNIVELNGIHIQGKFDLKNNKPYCNSCESSVWKPSLEGNIDVGYEIVYRCKCRKCMLRCWTNE